MKPMKKLLSFALFSLFLTACEKAPEQITLAGKTMGTTYSVKYIDNGQIKNLPNSANIKAEMDNLLKIVNSEMSTYQKDSQISRFNQMKEANQPFEVSDDFIAVVKEAIVLNKITEQALDITVGPLVNLWGFGPTKRINKAPTAEQIAEKAKAVGIDKLEIKDNQLIKKDPDVYIDLSSIAKGFGVDKLAEYLEHLGVENYLVEIGGELRGKGKNIQGQAWRIAIEKPALEQGSATQIVVPLNNLAMATSGDYRNYFEDEQGNRFSHIIDPKQLRPISHNLASITVFASTTMAADGLSTGLFVLGTEKALEIAEKENIPVFIILKNGENFETKSSTAFEKLIK